jgi:hypothetical protein
MPDPVVVAGVAPRANDLRGQHTSLPRRFQKVAAEMALSVLAYNLTRITHIVGIKPLMAAIAA